MTTPIKTNYKSYNGGVFFRNIEIFDQINLDIGSEMESGIDTKDQPGKRSHFVNQAFSETLKSE